MIKTGKTPKSTPGMTSLTTPTPTPTGTGLTTAAVAAQFESIDKQLKAARTNRDAADVDPTPSGVDREEKWSLAMIQLKKARSTLGSQMMVDIRALTAMAKQYGFGSDGFDSSVSIFLGGNFYFFNLTEAPDTIINVDIVCCNGVVTTPPVNCRLYTGVGYPKYSGFVHCHKNTTWRRSYQSQMQWME